MATRSSSRLIHSSQPTMDGSTGSSLNLRDWTASIVATSFTGHEHLFEHRVERYEDADGRKHRLNHIVTGGGGAPLYSYRGEPDLREYLKTYAAEKVSLDHVARPGMNPGDNPYHLLLVQVDGERIRIEIIGVDWGRGFEPCRSNTTELQDGNRE